jgi:hypothetical protein
MSKNVDIERLEYLQAMLARFQSELSYSIKVISFDDETGMGSARAFRSLDVMLREILEMFTYMKQRSNSIRELKER